MDIIIPTYGRANSQQTLAQLTAAGLNVILVVQAREHLEHSKYQSGQVTLVALPDHIRTIAPTRQYILDYVGDSEQFCMVDDDLVFFKRRDDDRTKLRDITSPELHEAFMLMAQTLVNYGVGHVGFAAREGANRNTEDTLHNTRIMRVLGYNRHQLKRHAIRFDIMEVMEDFHVALCLLKLNYRNVILNNFAHNQGGSGSRGGCSHFRTPELHARNAEVLAVLHPGVVKVVEKTTKGAWGGGTRKDVIIQWKKALNAKPNV